MWHQSWNRTRWLVILLLACGSMGTGTVLLARAPKAPVITSAGWTVRGGRLAVAGKYFPARREVVLSNAITGDLLGTAMANRSGSWRLTLKALPAAPCRVRATSGASEAELDVKRAPPGSCLGHDIAGEVKLVAFNDLGMHCYDKDFAVFAILPPFNVVHAQVLLKAGRSGNPEVLDGSSVTVTYEAVADASGSINRTSEGKTNFWAYVHQLFGMSPEPDQGLLGQRMPGADNVPQTFAAYDADHQWFTAAGIPITALDDALENQPYPLLRIAARSRASGRQLATLDVVVPASAEMHCSSCHSADGVAADAATAARWGIADWSSRADAEQAYRENILLLHDAKHATELMASQPVLCASCHYSPALDLAGSGPVGPQVGKPMLSHAIHGRHGATLDNHLPTPGDPAVIPEVPTTSCYQCHPGSSTKCLRGAMGDAGISCQDCHGGLLAVGGKYLLSDRRTRTPWADEPRCASCHTGDAVSHVGDDFRQLTAHDPADLGATPRQAPASRFAEQDGQLYRNSHGHGNLACEACHGSPHAIWPTGADHPNDNVAATQFQGHAGTIAECQSCHQQNLPLTLAGPHGMHNVNDARWNTRHEEFYERNPNACKACHGLALEGTALSRTAADRVLQTDDHGTLHLPKGTVVSCTLCHGAPDGGGDDDDDD